MLLKTSFLEINEIVTCDNNNHLVHFIDSGDVDYRPTPLYESRHRSLWSLQITITLTEGALMINLAI